MDQQGIGDGRKRVWARGPDRRQRTFSTAGLIKRLEAMLRRRHDRIARLQEDIRHLEARLAGLRAG